MGWPVFMTPFLVVPYAIHAFRSEYDRNAWDVLQTTTLKTWDLLIGKLKAGLRLFAWRFGAFYGVIFLAGIYTFFHQNYLFAHSFSTTGGLFTTNKSNFYLLISFVFLSFVWTTFYLSAGFYISTRCKHTTTAYVQMMLLVLFLFFAPIIAGILLSDLFHISPDSLLEPTSLISPFILFLAYWETEFWGFYLYMHSCFMIAASAFLLWMTNKRIEIRDM